MQSELIARLKAVKQPVPLTVDFIQGEDTITLVVYEDEVMRHDEDKRRLISLYLWTLQDTLRMYGWKSRQEGRHGSSPSR